MPKQNKTKRWNMRVVPDLDSRVQELSEQLGQSKNKTIEEILYLIVLEPKKMFSCCPTCGIPIFNSESTPITEGVLKMNCAKGHAHIFDFEENDWVT